MCEPRRPLVTQVWEGNASGGHLLRRIQQLPSAAAHRQVSQRCQACQLVARVRQLPRRRLLVSRLHTQQEPSGCLPATQGTASKASKLHALGAGARHAYMGRAYPDLQHQLRQHRWKGVRPRQAARPQRAQPRRRAQRVRQQRRSQPPLLERPIPGVVHEAQQPEAPGPRGRLLTFASYSARLVSAASTWMTSTCGRESTLKSGQQAESSQCASRGPRACTASDGLELGPDAWQKGNKVRSGHALRCPLAAEACKLRSR